MCTRLSVDPATKGSLVDATNTGISLYQYPYTLLGVELEEVSGNMWTVLRVTHASDSTDMRSLLVPSWTLDPSELPSIHGRVGLEFTSVSERGDVGFNRSVVTNLVISFPDGTTVRPPVA